MSKRKSSGPLRSNYKKITATIAIIKFVERTLAFTVVRIHTLFNIRKELRHDNRKKRLKYILFQADSNPCNYDHIKIVNQ